MEMKSKSIIKTASIITLLTMLSKLFGLVRELLIAYFFGTSVEVDMYIMAINIPTILLGCITCIGTAHTPVYAEVAAKKGEEKAAGFTTSLVFLTSLICITVILAASLKADMLVRIAAPGFTEQMVSRTTDYLRITLWNLLVTAVMNIYISYLHCRDRFIQASFCMLVHGGVQVLFTILVSYIGIKFLTVGYVLANICYLIAVIIVCLKNGYRFRRTFYESKYVKMLIRLVAPIAISSLVTQINGYIDKYYASGLPEGNISALHYSNIIRTFVVMMLNTGLVTIFYPVVAKMASESNIVGMKKTLVSSIGYIILCFIPVTILLIKFSEIMIDILFRRGQFDAESVHMTATAIKMYAVGITAVALRDILFNFFYSVKKTVFTLVISLLTIAVNVILNAFLVETLGIGGLALATSLSAIATMPLLFTYLNKYLDFQTEKKYLMKVGGKCVLSGIIPLGVLWLLEKIWRKGYVITSLIEGIVYIMLYLLFLKLFNVKEVDIVCSNLRSKVKRNKYSS